MWIDFTIAVILIVCIFRGDKRGFILSFVNTFGWLVSLGASYLCQASMVQFLDKNTNMRHDITVKIMEYIKTRMMADASGVEVGDTIPGAIASMLTSAADKAMTTTATSLAEPIADAVMGILAFFILALGLKFVIHFIERIISHFVKKNQALSALNSMGGMVLGLVKGCFFSYVLLLLVILIAVIGDITIIMEQIQNSMIFEILSTAGLMPFSGDLMSALEQSTNIG